MTTYRGDPRHRRAWLTPANLPEAFRCRQLLIPDDPAWLAIVNDALWKLTFPANFEQSDEGIDPVAVGEVFLAMLDRFWSEDCVQMSALRQSPDNSCLLQYFDDATATWVTFADTSLCVTEPDALYRYNPDTGELQRSIDNGASWDDARDADPRFSGTMIEPDDAFACLAAQAIVAFIQHMVEDLMTAVDGGSLIVGAAGVIRGFVALAVGVSAAVPAVMAAAAFALTLTKAAVNAALTDDVWERLLCNIYCTIRDKNRITPGDYDVIRQTIMDDEEGIAEALLWHMVTNLGSVGLQNVVAAGMDALTTLPNCDDCCDEEPETGLWELRFDLRSGLGQVAVPWPCPGCWASEGYGGVWVSGVGIDDTNYTGSAWGASFELDNLGLTTEHNPTQVRVVSSKNGGVGGNNSQIHVHDTTTRLNQINNQTWNQVHVQSNVVGGALNRLRVRHVSALGTADNRIHEILIWGDGLFPSGATAR